MRNETTVMILVLALVWLLNFVDGLMTVVWVQFGVALEANPLMAEIVERPVVFLSTKTVLVTLGSLLLWRFRSFRLAKASALLALVCYAGILVVHTRIALHLESIPYDQVKLCLEMLSR